MTTHPLFYRSVVPLNREAHRKLRLDQGDQPYAFASKTHIIPAVIDEFPVAARHLPILFVPGSPLPSPVFLVGLTPGQNVFVDGQGNWSNSYVPAFVRRYPFMLGETPEGGSLACIDETFPAFKKSNGEALFERDGSDSVFLQQKIRLINDYFAAAKRTDAFARVLHDLQLLRGVTIETKAEGVSAALHGLLVVNETRLNELPADDFMNLRQQGFLSVIYAHIVSLNAMDALRQATFGSIAASPPVDARSQEPALQ
jgi:hypothetical protein